MVNDLLLKDHSVNQLDNFIMGWYCDPLLCDKMVDYFESKKKFIIDKSQSYKGYKSVNTLLHDQENISLCEEYFSTIYRCTDRYRSKYEYCDKSQAIWALQESMNIQMYEPGYSYSVWHAEMVGPPNFSDKRNLVYMTYLNDINEGGETEFLYQKLKIKPEKGLTLIWPAYWMHTHKGLPSNEIKYIATGWFEYKN
jgi:prolyl 4-hydroxylase